MVISVAVAKGTQIVTLVRLISCSPFKDYLNREPFQPIPTRLSRTIWWFHIATSFQLGVPLMLVLIQSPDFPRFFAQTVRFLS
jgi:hypothetical protein